MGAATNTGVVITSGTGSPMATLERIPALAEMLAVHICFMSPVFSLPAKVSQGDFL